MKGPNEHRDSHPSPLCTWRGKHHITVSRNSGRWTFGFDGINVVGEDAANPELSNASLHLGVARNSPRGTPAVLQDPVVSGVANHLKMRRGDRRKTQSPTQPNPTPNPPQKKVERSVGRQVWMLKSERGQNTAVNKQEGLGGDRGWGWGWG